MTYIPTHSDLPCLKIPENRAKYAYQYYKVCKDHPHAFAAYAYWLERCANDGTDY